MTLESLTTIIKAKVPRLRPWEMEVLAEAIMDSEGVLSHVDESGLPHCPECGKVMQPS